MKLSTTQRIILTDMIGGMRYKEISSRRFISLSYIKKTITEAMRINGCKTVTQLAVKFSREIAH